MVHLVKCQLEFCSQSALSVLLWPLPNFTEYFVHFLSILHAPKSMHTWKPSFRALCSPSASSVPFLHCSPSILGLLTFMQMNTVSTHILLLLVFCANSPCFLLILIHASTGHTRSWPSIFAWERTRNLSIGSYGILWTASAEQKN